MSESRDRVFIDSKTVRDHSGDTGGNIYSGAEGYDDPLYVFGGHGNDRFLGRGDDDWFQAGDGGRAAYVFARGGDGNDYLAGGKGANVLTGGRGYDWLVGNQDDAFADLIYGGHGGDRLIAGRVRDGSRIDDGTGALTDSTKGTGWSGGKDGNDNPTGNTFIGGPGDDWFVLNSDSYVYLQDLTLPHMTEYTANWDRIVVAGLGDDYTVDDFTVVHHPGGAYGTATFRLKLGNKVLAEINHHDPVDPDDEEAVAAAVRQISGQIDYEKGEWLNGTAGDDILQGTGHADEIHAWAGDDYIIGGKGSDILEGGDGDDELHGAHGNDTLRGGDGDDYIIGGAGNDRLDGGAGRDILFGEGGRDIFVIASLQAGPDLIMDFNVSEDVIRLPVGVRQADMRFVWNDARKEHQLVTGTGAAQKVLARFANLGSAHNAAYLNANVHFIRDFDPAPEPVPEETIDGTARRDLLVGGADTINGQGGMDTLYGQGGNDTMDGGAKRNVLYGNEGADTLYGGDGIDLLFGGIGDDVLHGEAGNDRLHGDQGADTLNGSAGDDVLHGGAGDDVLHGGTGDDVLHGGAGDDVLHGGAGDDVLHGGAGDDVLHGGAGNDVLHGGAGNDVLHGGAGNDTLTGGGGNDNFLFRKGDGADVITDFEAGADTIVILAQTEAQAQAGQGEMFIDFDDLNLGNDQDSDGRGFVVITSEEFAEGQQITVQGVTSGQLTDEDIDFLTMDAYNDQLIIV